MIAKLGSFILLFVSLVPKFCVISLRSQEDLDTIDRLIADAEASHNKWRHPDPYIGKDLS